jgi:hypothetical protein
MLDSSGGGGDAQVSNTAGGEARESRIAAVRARVKGRVPALTERCRRLLEVAEVATLGPDAEAALPHLEAARRALASFLRLTRIQ